MSDPRRWLESEDAAPEVLDLLRSARPARSLDSTTRERSKRRIARALAVPAVASAFFWLQPAALGAALGAAVTGAVVAARVATTDIPETSDPRSTPVIETHARPVAPVLPAASPRETPESVPAPTAAAGAKRASAPRAESPEDTLEREARMLERARALLPTDAAAALATLNRHQSEFPRGALAIERDLLSVDALLRLGQRSEAETRAGALRRSAPGSLYDTRLNELLAKPR
jgi:hypothetical protein